MGVETHVFKKIGVNYINDTPQELYNCLRFVNADEAHTSTDKRRFRSFFGTSPEICHDLWDMLSKQDPLPNGGGPKHLLWALLFLKEYAIEPVLARMVGSDEKTYRKWVKIVVNKLSWLEMDVVSQSANALPLFCSKSHVRHQIRLKN